MPRGRKRRWKAFKNKVLAVAEKDLGTQQIVFNYNYSLSNNVSGNQLLGYACLFPGKSSDGAANDLYTMGTLFSSADNTVANGLAMGPSSKVIFQSGIMDITIRNSSTYFDGSTTSLDSRARMEVDIYECSMTKDAEEYGQTFANPLLCFADNDPRTNPIGGGATTEINLTKRGVTPFDLSYVLSRWGVKIWTKRKYQISNNDQITYQVRDPRRHSMTLRELTNADGFNKPRLTRFIVIVGRVSPGLTIGSTTGTFQEGIQLGLTRKYTAKVENWSEDRTAYITA